MQPECRQHPTAQPEGLSKDYSARYSRGILSLSNYGPYKPCNPWHLSAGLVMHYMCIHDDPLPKMKTSGDKCRLKPEYSKGEILT